MALIQCKKCGQMVANTGKCPKCGALLCKECGHEVGTKDLKCPNCGRDTKLLQEKMKKGVIWLVVGIMFMILIFSGSGARSSGEAFFNLVVFLVGVVFLIMGIFNIAKYGKIKHYS